VREAILAAAFKVLLERGYDGMAIEAVAVAAGAGKTTIYRWWAGKAELAVDAFFHATREELMLPQTGSARDDFRSQITDLAELLRGERGVVLAAMLGGARTDPTLAAALGKRWLEPRRKWGVERMTRAVREGQCRPGVDVAAALGVLYGPLYAPLLFGQGVPSAAQVEAHLAIAFAGIFR
jgi:AcrR family transcriptional regulator